MNEERKPRFLKKYAGRKPLLLIVCLVLLAAVAVGGTVAWIHTSAGPIVNTMVPGSVSLSVGTASGNAAVTNTGNVNAYIRVAIAANAVDANGNVTTGTAPAYQVNSAFWTELDGYYYYKNVVTPGKTTANLFSANANVTGGEIHVFAESIQAVGSYDGKNPETYAWGVSYSDGTWSKAGGE